MNMTATNLNPNANLNSDLEQLTSEQNKKQSIQTSANTDTNTNMSKKKSSKKRLFLKILLGFFIFLVLIGSILAVIGYQAYAVALTMKQQADQLQLTGGEIMEAVKTQNLPLVQQKMVVADEQLANLNNEYTKLAYFQNIPFLNSYYQDGIRGLEAADAGLNAVKLTVDALIPYAEVLGFSGEDSFTGGTAEDRVKLLLDSLVAIEPQLDSIANELTKAQSALSQIDANRYPETFQGIAIKSRLLQAQSAIESANQALNQYRPILLRLPSIAGSLEDGRRKYLVLFQNDNELRPTGGFLTAYAIINVDKGKVEAEKSDDIYELDKKFSKRQPIPPKLGKYLITEKYFNLRDMNIDPDFKNSMDLFSENYRNIKGEPQNIDGIIAVDTKILTDLVRILGPVNVPGYGTFSAEIDSRCDCPQIIYALSEIITRPVGYIKEDRKGILGPLMREILTKTYQANKSQFPQIIESGFAGLQGRHIQLYFFNEEDQKATELINAAGRMIPPKENEDFLAIVNANLAGAKSNLFITYDVLQEVANPENGFIEKTVAITYKNPRGGDNCNLEAGLLCLNSTNNDWTRLFVPAGSQLVSAEGFKNEVETYDENGFTVFDGFHTLQPKGSTKLIVTYRVPYTDANTYRLKQWKQGGVEKFSMILDVNGDQQAVDVVQDTSLSAQF